VKLSCCGLQKKIEIGNCGVAVAELQYISLKSFGIAIAEVFLQVKALRLRTQKKVARAHLCFYDACNVFLQNLVTTLSLLGPVEQYLKCSI
jgi:hypothetical protein